MESNIEIKQRTTISLQSLSVQCYQELAKVVLRVGLDEGVQCTLDPLGLLEEQGHMQGQGEQRASHLSGLTWVS